MKKYSLQNIIIYFCANEYINNTKLFYLIFFLLLLAPFPVHSQNSLYLVDTLTGTATNNKLMKAIGIGDMNGDGYADFVICYQQYIDLYYGNPQFKLKLAHRFYIPPQSPYFGGGAYAIGDVNGDGYADLMIISGDTTYIPTHPYWEIILGGKELDTIPKFTYWPPYYWGMMPNALIYPLGDLNGDGYNDFAIASQYNWDDGIGRVYIFKGGKTLVSTPWAAFKGTLADMFYGSTVAGIGDHNNDGYDDFLISVTSNEHDSDKVYMFLGNKDAISSIPYKTFVPPTIRFIWEVKPAGNLNGKGKKDFIISTADKVYIYTSNDDPIVFDPYRFGGDGSASIGAGGDINNDGYDDYIIGNFDYLNADSGMVGDAIGFWGGETININNPAFKMEGDKKWFYYAKFIDIAGDINGDGYADVFVIQESYPDFDHLLGKLFIYSYSKITDVKAQDNKTTPSKFELNQNYPNPFNPSTTISYQLPFNSKVSLRIFDILGKEIATLINEEKDAGSYKLNFNADKYRLSSGVYFLEIKISGVNSGSTPYHKAIKMLYLR
jgi:hypothetical protein